MKKERLCIRCQEPFESNDAGHRVCPNCERRAARLEVQRKAKKSSSRRAGRQRRGID